MQDFARLDVEKKGFVEVAELKRVMGGNDAVTDALIGEYDASGDGAACLLIRGSHLTTGT